LPRVDLEVTAEYDIGKEAWEFDCRLIVVIATLLVIAMPCDRYVSIVVCPMIERELTNNNQHIRGLLM
jgi:hypothetical protein